MKCSNVCECVSQQVIWHTNPYVRSSSAHWPSLNYWLATRITWYGKAPKPTIVSVNWNSNCKKKNLQVLTRKYFTCDYLMMRSKEMLNGSETNLSQCSFQLSKGLLTLVPFHFKSNQTIWWCPNINNWSGTLCQVIIPVPIKSFHLQT